MKTIINPSINAWKDLLQRPQLPKNELDQTVKDILTNVKQRGDQALRDYAQQFDNANISSIQVSENEMEKACNLIDNKLKEAIRLAANNIEKFHESQRINEPYIETTPGVTCWRKSLPIEKVGLYIPGGTAPLFSTVLMLGIPAKVAKCKEIILCSPPNEDGQIHPAVLFAANLIGIKKIFKVGGAQAIGAMAFGTESVTAVYKIFGPGNQYVTRAKELVQQYGTAIDMPAGPSELLVVADDTAIPEFVAADLLSQAEHGVDSQVMLITPSQELSQEVMKSLASQLDELPRKQIAQEALENSTAIVLNNLESCIDFSNQYAPEHLIICTEKDDMLIQKITAAGSVFIGPYSCESAGDYASGTNHSLPTNGFTRQYSGVSLDSFLNKVTFQKLSKQGLKNIGPAIETMAEAEQLQAHKNAVTIRLNTLK